MPAYSDIVKQLKVVYEADSTAAIASTRRLSSEIDKAQAAAASKTSAIASAFKNMGTAMSIGVTLPVIAAGKSMIDSAMRATETVNLYEVSVGKMKDSTDRWVSGMHRAYGINKYGAMQAVGTFDVMLHSMGLAEDQAASMAEKLSEVGYDMASFYNLTNEDAFEKLMSGISGETEPLKRLGIIINETQAKNYALTQGWVKHGQELSEIQKIQARYNLILQQTTTAQGDLARTLDSPANQLRRLKEEFSMVSVELGQKLVPAAVGAMKSLNGLVGFMGNHPNLTVGMLGGLALGGPALNMLGNIAELRGQASTRKSAEIASAQHLLTNATKDADAALESQKKNFDALKKSARLYKDEIQSLYIESNDSPGGIAKNWQQYPSLVEGRERMRNASTEAAAANGVLAASQDKVTLATKAAAKVGEAQYNVLKRLGGGLKSATTSILSFIDANKGMIAVTMLATVAYSYYEHTKAVKEHVKALREEAEQYGQNEIAAGRYGKKLSEYAGSKSPATQEAKAQAFSRLSDSAINSRIQKLRRQSNSTLNKYEEYDKATGWFQDIPEGENKVEAMFDWGARARFGRQAEDFKKQYQNTISEIELLKSVRDERHANKAPAKPTVDLNKALEEQHAINVANLDLAIATARNAGNDLVAKKREADKTYFDAVFESEARDSETGAYKYSDAIRKAMNSTASLTWKTSITEAYKELYEKQAKDAQEARDKAKQDFLKDISSRTEASSLISESKRLKAEDAGDLIAAAKAEVESDNQSAINTAAQMVSEGKDPSQYLANAILKGRAKIKSAQKEVEQARAEAEKERRSQATSETVARYSTQAIAAEMSGDSLTAAHSRAIGDLISERSQLDELQAKGIDITERANELQAKYNKTIADAAGEIQKQRKEEAKRQADLVKSKIDDIRRESEERKRAFTEEMDRRRSLIGFTSAENMTQGSWAAGLAARYNYPTTKPQKNSDYSESEIVAAVERLRSDKTLEDARTDRIVAAIKSLGGIDID